MSLWSFYHRFKSVVLGAGDSGNRLVTALMSNFCFAISGIVAIFIAQGRGRNFFFSAFVSFSVIEDLYVFMSQGYLICTF